MIFTGHAELTIDAKQRMAIPAKHRARHNAERDGAAWYCVPWGRRKLMLYTEKRFEEMAERGEFTLTPDDETSDRASNFFGMCERLEPDSAGRIIIPAGHKKIAGIGESVVVVGCGKYLEVWDHDAWVNGLEERFDSLKKEINQSGTKSKQPGTQDANPEHTKGQ